MQKLDGRKIVTSSPEQLMRLYDTGLTYREIGEAEGVSRERIRQILRKYNPNFGRNFYSGTGKLNRIARVSVTCARADCLNSFTKKSSDPKRFCSVRCVASVSPYRSSDPEYPAWRKEYARKAARKHYHEVFKKRPDWREITRDRNKAYSIKRYGKS